MKRGFTLIEILVVISIIALLMGILMPAMSRAREQARIVVANAELYGIGIALEAYSMGSENKYPPTRAECSPDARKHIYALPQELIHQGYLPKGGKIGKILYARLWYSTLSFKSTIRTLFFDDLIKPFALQSKN